MEISYKELLVMGILSLVSGVFFFRILLKNEKDRQDMFQDPQILLTAMFFLLLAGVLLVEGTTKWFHSPKPPIPQPAETRSAH